MRLNFLECPWLDCSAIAQRMEQRCQPQGDCIAAFVLSPELLLLRYFKAWLNEFVTNREITEMLLVCRSYLAVAMWGTSVYHLFLSSTNETARIWLFLSYHGKWVVHLLLNLVPGSQKWFSICRNDDGGCYRGIGVAVAGVSFWSSGGRYQCLLYHLFWEISYCSI